MSTPDPCSRHPPLQLQRKRSGRWTNGGLRQHPPPARSHKTEAPSARCRDTLVPASRAAPARSVYPFSHPVALFLHPALDAGTRLGLSGVHLLCSLFQVREEGQGASGGVYAETNEKRVLSQGGASVRGLQGKRHLGHFVPDATYLRTRAASVVFVIASCNRSAAGQSTTRHARTRRPVHDRNRSLMARRAPWATKKRSNVPAPPAGGCEEGLAACARTQS